ncbi:MAG TPA: glycosyltransferase family 39 protein [Anaerolineales bacterium]|nr:glycosyltransferase family 39 protein [Anaerolineales bacterium]
MASLHVRSNRWLLVPAVLCGFSFALFASGYWLMDIYPAGSRLLILITATLAMLASAAFYFLFAWARGLLSELTIFQRWAFIGASLIVAAILLFAGTSRWRSDARYIPFLLPEHHVSISFVPGTSSVSGKPGVRLSWFHTALGDVSYDAIRQAGWKRAGDELVLQNASNNKLEWEGKTGAGVELNFRQAEPDGKLTIAWDGGEAEQFVSAAGKLTYQHALSVPWYASRAFVIGLGITALAGLVLPLLLLLWHRRLGLVVDIGNALTGVTGPLDRVDAAVMLGAALIALALRLPNLGGFFPAVDEYYHLIAARQIAEGAALASVYPRGLWLVTVPVSLALRLFGYQLWAARIVGVLFNVLAILPLYLLTRRINRPVAALSVLLYAASPWIVTFARIAREYAVYPFYFYWIILGMVCLIELIPRGAVLAHDWREILTPRTLALALLLFLPPIFALYGDRLSTFRTILLAYPVFMVFLFGRFDWRNRLNLLFLALVGGGFVIAAYGWFERQKSKIVPFPRYNSVPVEYFLPNPQQQWYFDRLVLLPVAGLLVAVACSVLVGRRNFLPAFVLSLWAAYLGFFAFFSETFFHTRHLSTTELWYIIVAAMGLYLLWKLVKLLIPWKGKLAGIAVAGVLCLSMVNVPQVVAPTVSTDPDNPISEDYLHDLTQVQAYMVDHVQPGDTLISTVYGFYSAWKEEPKFEARYRITTQTPPQEILTLIEQHDSGWIVVDRIRLDMSDLGLRTFAGIPDVQYVGTFGDEYVWHWQHPSAVLGGVSIAGKE